MMRAIWYSLFMALVLFPGGSIHAQSADQLLLKNFRPESIYRVPETRVEKAAYPVIDFHSHDYPKTDADLDAWVRNMDSTGIDQAMILSYRCGPSFDSVVRKYARYKDRFTVWCGFDYKGMDKPGWSKRAVAELERCYREGARGVGELGDKGLGDLYSKPVPGYGVHIDDPRLSPLLEKCGELHMPVSVHVAEDAWMYLPADSTNDGLMNSATWKVDMNVPGKLNHDQLLATLERAVREHPHTIFIACHLANSCANLAVLGRLFDRYPNLYADIAARYGEIAPIPRFARAFMEKYADRLLYGTDMGMSKAMYRVTFRILETDDEHFYAHQYFSYHWPLYGIGLSRAALKRIYRDNGLKLLGK